MKADELIDAELDAAVAHAEGGEARIEDGVITHVFWKPKAGRICWAEYSPSTDWAQGGPIIEREEISVTAPMDGPEGWKASPPGAGRSMRGTTPLIAAMRAYVASKFGREFDTFKGVPLIVDKRRLDQ